MRKLLYLLPLVLGSIPALAQEEVVEKTASGNTLVNIILIAVVITSILLLIVALTLLKTFKSLSKELVNPTPFQAAQPEKRLEWEEWYALEKSKPSIWNKLLELRPISEEKDIRLEHEFDGITELDNPTPKWFMYLFYATIIFAVAYLFAYHVTGWGKMQEEEYVVEMEQAEIAKQEYLAKSNNNIDENNVKESAEAAVIAAGAAVYQSNCVACHGDKAQGTVGPNLTDEYWLHGGKINNVFKSIKCGIPEKGMISWEKTLTPKQISDVSNYIKSLKGTNPGNAKAPQGEKES